MKKEKKIIIKIIIFIIIIILIFFSINRFGLIYVKVPTGNVDIFDITIANGDGCKNCCNCNNECDGNCTCSNCDKNKQSTTDNTCDGDSCDSNNSNGTWTSISKWNSSKNNAFSQSDGVIAYDKDVIYGNKTKLNIFTNYSYYIVNGKIAPSSENTYQFIIRNNNNFGIKYDLKIEEENQYNINMRYKLRVNGEAITEEGKWVTAEELSQYNNSLAYKSYDVYSLEWKWVESDNDTEIGEDVNSNYKLNISFYATQI